MDEKKIESEKRRLETVGFRGFPKEDYAQNRTSEKSEKSTKSRKTVISLSQSHILRLELDAKKKLAEIEAKREEAELEFQLKQLSLRREKEKREKEREKEIIELELQVQLSRSTCNRSLAESRKGDFQDLEENIEVQSIHKVSSWIAKNNSYFEEACALPFENSEKEVVKSNKIEENPTSSNLEKILLRQTIDKELPFFSGNVREWASFYNQYSYTTNFLQLSEEENICRLRKCLKGDARRSVEGLLISSSVKASDVVETLKNKYGRPDVIVKNLISEVRNAPFVRNNDFASLTYFAETVSNLVLTLDSLKMERYLYCPQLMDDLVQKLPYGLQMSWGEKVSRHPENVSLQEFRSWINLKAVAVSYIQSSAQKINQPTKRTMVMTNSRNKNTEKPTLSCLICKQDHTLENCKKFIDKTIQEKWNIVKNNKICFCCLKSYHRITDCRNKRKCGEANCEKYHHRLLHFKRQLVQNSQPEERNTEQVRSSAESHSCSQLIAHTSSQRYNEILLKITSVILRTKETEVKIYALFDEGSTISILDESLANELNLPGEETNLNLRWTDKTISKQVRSRTVNFEISGIEKNEFFKMTNVYTIKDLDLPVQNVNANRLRSKWTHLKDINFPNVENIQPKLLIGQDYWQLITSREIIEGPKNSPALSRTRLGWVVHGNTSQFKNRFNENYTLLIRREDPNEDLHNLVKYFFSTESLGVKVEDKKNLTTEDEQAENLIKSISRRKNDRWETGLLWKNLNEELPENKNVAIQRFKYLERKMSMDSEFQEAYRKKIKEYQEKNYIRKLSPTELEKAHKRTWYLPHFGVVNPNKPGKMRFVMDAASKSHGKCLDDFLLKGPDLYVSLVGILMKFREKNIAFSADIREMFHMVLINEEDQHAQRILWRNSPEEDFEVYVMKVMIFGAVSSPFSAQYIKNLNALEFSQMHPEAVEAILERHYMDDYLDSCEDTKKAIQIVQDVISIHKQGGFELRGWVCNNQEVYDKIPEELRSAEKYFDNAEQHQRILGLKWQPKEDILTFPLSLEKIDMKIVSGEKVPTKREMLKLIMSLFDPLGLLGHYIVKAKILMQDVWKSGLGWDSKITEEQFKKWSKWIKNLEEIKMVKIQRCYDFNFTEDMKLELHLFCDASAEAMATAAYFRFENGAKVNVRLVMSKNQVSPMKPMTIPRLELQAAVMASRLAKTVENEHRLPIKKTIFWSDSTTVLTWLNSESKKLTSFIINRVGEILENSNKSQWRWIPSKLNVADDATRSETDTDLSEKSRWFNGPEFLYLPSYFWPTESLNQQKTIDHTDKEDLEEETTEIVLVNVKLEDERNSALPNIKKFSSLTRLLLATAYVLKFTDLLRKRCKEKRISSCDLKTASKLWCLQVQKECFEEEYKELMKGKCVPKRSKIYNLSPCIYNGLICLKGRIENCTEIKEETRHPIILSNKHRFTELLIADCHKKFNHAGVQLVLNEIRQTYWIVQGRKLITAVINKCNLCKIRKAKPVIPEMGQLPLERLQRPPRPFTFVGIDYFGPLQVTIGRRHEKRYGVLFTCLSIRAVHLELAETLNTDSAILAIRRFISRRGQPQCIWSDNGTNFCAADKELRQALKEIDDNEIREHYLAKTIDWKRIPPASPHMGGSWERMVRSVKSSLKIVLKEKAPKLEVLETLLVEVEHIVNSRPLTYVSNNENDIESLTPNHFLIGKSSIVKSPGNFSMKSDLRKQWRFSQQLADRYWQRWLKEYIPTLATRTKWLEQNRNIEINEVVVVMDNQLPRNNWPLGRVIATYPGSDGNIRVVDVKTLTGTYKRPLTKICRINDTEFTQDDLL